MRTVIPPLRPAPAKGVRQPSACLHPPHLHNLARSFADRFLSEGHVGPFVGVQAASQQYRLRNSRLGSGEAQYTSMLLMPRFGYLWKPGSSGFYIMPWVGVGYADKVSGEARLAGVDFHLSKVMAFATVHVGWRF